jgi:hypothetical protein
MVTLSGAETDYQNPPYSGLARYRCLSVLRGSEDLHDFVSIEEERDYANLKNFSGVRKIESQV